MAYKQSAYEKNFVTWLKKQKPKRKFCLDSFTEWDDDHGRKLPVCPIAQFEADTRTKAKSATAADFREWFILAVDGLPNKSRKCTAAKALQVAKRVSEELKNPDRD